MIMYIVLGLILAIAFVAPLRRLLLTQFILQAMKKKMPSISSTEQEAIDAGTVWWEKSLMRGSPDWAALDEVSPVQLSQDEQAFIDGPVETLCAMVDDWETHQKGDLSAEVWAYLKEQRFFGMGIPKAYGGLEFCASAHSEVIQKISSRSGTAAVTAMVPNSLGPAELLLHYGTTEQKDYYLPRLACGQEVPCFALTGPDAGSDAGSIPDSGIVEKGMFDGKEVLGIRLNWNKRYITLAPVATLVGLAFHLFDPNHLLGEKEDIGITVALIPADTEGVIIGNRHNPLYIPFQNGPTQGKDVFIPMSYIVGDVEYVGQGWRMLMESLAAGRAISLPALSCGGGKVASRITSAYVRVREQFGLPLGRFEGVSERVANIAITSYTINATRKLSARAVDIGEKPSVLSAIAKYNTTEAMRQAIIDAMDIVGGKGICAGPQNLLAHGYMAIPIAITVEGANILTRSMIVFGQGGIRCNPYILQEIAGMANPDKTEGLRQFDEAMFAHIWSLITGGARALRFGIIGGAGSPVPDITRLAGSYQQINRLSAIFSFIADLSMVLLGGKLKVKESISGRLADALSGLYQASAILKFYRDKGEPREEQLLAESAVVAQLVRVEVALDGVLRNYPFPLLGRLLRYQLFPFGLKLRSASDDVLHQVTHDMMEYGGVRDEITKGIFIPEGDNEPLHLLEAAMKAASDSEPLRLKLREKYGGAAVKPAYIEATIAEGFKDKLINEDERNRLSLWVDLRNKVVAVDDFEAGGVA